MIYKIYICYIVWVSLLLVVLQGLWCYICFSFKLAANPTLAMGGVQ